MQKLVMRRETVISLFTSLVQEWKARDLVSKTLEPVNKDSRMIDRVLVELYGVNNSLRLNDYSDSRLSNYLGVLYNVCNCPCVKAAPKVAEYALDTTDRIMDLCRALGYKGQFSDEWTQQTDIHYALLYLTRCWGTNLKYHSQWLFNHYENQKQSIRPAEIVGTDGSLCYGKPGQTIRRRLRGWGLKAMESRLTILQGFKKSLLPLQEEDWFATVEGTAQSLGNEAPDMTEEVCQELVRTGRELARKMPAYVVRKNFKLSTSACRESKRSEGGFAGEYFRRMGIRNSIIYRISPPYLVGDFSTVGTEEVGLVYSRCEFNYRDVYNEYASCSNMSILSERAAVVDVRVIPEPFKFRVISVGEFNSYSVLKPLQVMLWKTLQKFECFSLTGKGADDLLLRAEGIITKYWDVGMKFLSGDYKAATNMLSSYAAQTLSEAWLVDYPELSMVLKKSLYTSTLDFEKSGLGVTSSVPEQVVDGTVFPDVTMLNGQLMGHPCSFPILCGVNAAICRMVLEKVWGRRFSLDDLPLLVNGDDCLLVGPDSLYGEWKSRIGEVGLVESVGKTYVSDKFAMINSRYLSIRTRAVNQDWDQWVRKDLVQEIPTRYVAYVAHDVGYCNLGILVGRKKGSNVDCEVNVAERVDDDSAYAFWQSAADNFKQMNLRCQRLSVDLGRYVKSFQRFFSAIPLDLHLPKEQGGFGFEVEGQEKTLLSYKFRTTEKSPFVLTKASAVMLGEAYYCGGMASVYDDNAFPNFLEEAREWSKLSKRWAVRRMDVASCDPEPKVCRQWTVTTC
jgi:hypothetical protein